ncbi:hypothetical protein M501DRAFT_1057744 [Patellaria atrata CBS 101060]|uniref:Uncharacterized protein n=1 Tax=Patellaria atrata CBS 101060 TaxID=1346257 RepID=A0A9P4SB75_9PEZI|nr:hypothetical protein M501DRAFT_1057744 [Patellaria atrata CBS 101060]
MKTTTVLTTLFALLAAGIDSASASCFTSGEVWQDKGDARYHANRAYRRFDGNQGAFQGFFAPGEAKRAYIQHSNTQKLEFFVQNLNIDAGFDLGDGDYALRLENEINGCDRGGQSDIAGWRFRADPNNGIC